MATSRSSKKRKSIKKLRAKDLSDVPFVPDYKLLESRRDRPTQDEVTAIGLWLLNFTSSNCEAQSAWVTSARLSGVSSRL